MATDFPDLVISTSDPVDKSQHSSRFTGSGNWCGTEGSDISTGTNPIQLLGSEISGTSIISKSLLLFPCSTTKTTLHLMTYKRFLTTYSLCPSEHPARLDPTCVLWSRISFLSSATSYEGNVGEKMAKSLSPHHWMFGGINHPDTAIVRVQLWLSILDTAADPTRTPKT